MLQVRPVSTTEYGLPCQAGGADPSAATTPPPSAPPPLFLPSPCSPAKPAKPAKPGADAQTATDTMELLIQLAAQLQIQQQEQVAERRFQQERQAKTDDKMRELMEKVVHLQTPNPPAPPPPLFLPSPCCPAKPALPFPQPTHWRPSSCSPNLPDSKRRRSAKKVWFSQPMPTAQLNSCPSAHMLEYCKTITVQSVKGKIGFSMSGEKPSMVVAVKPEGPGYLAGVCLNQIIVKVNNEQVLHSASLSEVTEKIQLALQLSNSVSLKMMHVRKYRLRFPPGGPSTAGPRTVRS